MKPIHYQLDKPIDAVVFDCDGTLSTIEGINYLAEVNGVGERVKVLTEQAMSVSGISDSLYEERLSLVRPKRQQVVDLALTYFSARVHQVVAVIELLQSLGKVVYVVSAGINPAVKLFASMLAIPANQVIAVDVWFDTDGNFEGYDKSCPCGHFSGKKVIAQKIRADHPRLVWVGDGMNDVVVKDDVERFVGFGGQYYREKVAAVSDFYMKSTSMAPLLPLVLTIDEVSALADKQLFQVGVSRIEAGEVE